MHRETDDLSVWKETKLGHREIDALIFVSVLQVVQGYTRMIFIGRICFYVFVFVYAYIIEDTLPEVCGYVKHSSILCFSGWLWLDFLAPPSQQLNMFIMMHVLALATGTSCHRYISSSKPFTSTFLHEIICESDPTWRHNAVDASEIRSSPQKGMYCKTWTWNPDIFITQLTTGYLLLFANPAGVLKHQQDVFYCNNVSISLHFPKKEIWLSGARY